MRRHFAICNSSYFINDNANSLHFAHFSATSRNGHLLEFIIVAMTAQQECSRFPLVGTVCIISPPIS